MYYNVFHGSVVFAITSHPNFPDHSSTANEDVMNFYKHSPMTINGNHWQWMNIIWKLMAIDRWWPFIDKYARWQYSIFNDNHWQKWLLLRVFFRVLDPNWISWHSSLHQDWNSWHRHLHLKWNSWHSSLHLKWNSWDSSLHLDWRGWHSSLHLDWRGWH